jgi:hypothetical protein
MGGEEFITAVGMNEADLLRLRRKAPSRTRGADTATPLTALGVGGAPQS